MSGFSACELGEIIAHRPTRCVPPIRTRRATLVFEVHVAGSLPPRVGATFAGAFQTLRAG